MKGYCKNAYKYIFKCYKLLDLYLSVGGSLDFLMTKGFVGVGIGIPVTWAWYMDSLPLKFHVKAGPLVVIGGGTAMLEFIGSAGALYYF